MKLKLCPNCKLDLTTVFCGHGNCRKKVVQGRTKCQEHLDRQKMDAASRRAEWRKEGICQRCGLYRSPLGRNCDNCRKYLKDYYYKKGRGNGKDITNPA